MRKSVKEFVASRAHWCCEYCLSPVDYSSDPFAIEHVMPIVKGGKSDLMNLAFSCLGCNNFKFTATQGRDPDTGIEVPLYNPRTDIWSEHFHWEDGFTKIIGHSPTGRAMVEKLHLNRPGLVNLRTALIAIGKHPPVFE